MQTYKVPTYERVCVLNTVRSKTNGLIPVYACSPGVPRNHIYFAQHLLCRFALKIDRCIKVTDGSENFFYLANQFKTADRAIVRLRTVISSDRRPPVQMVDPAAAAAADHYLIFTLLVHNAVNNHVYNRR